MEKKKTGFVNFEHIQEFYLDTLATVLHNSKDLSPEQKDKLATDIDNAFNTADFSHVQVIVFDD